MKPLPNNTFIHQHKDWETEIGDVKQEDFYPQVKVKKWNNEVNFSYRLLDTAQGTPELVHANDLVTWKKPDIEAHFYKTKINHFHEQKSLDLGMHKAHKLGEVKYTNDEFPMLTIDGKYWGADSEGERTIRKVAGEKAYGAVLVAGLGLGVINEYLLLNPRVTSITVLEFSQDVIDIVKEHYPARLDGVKVIVDDYFDYAKNTLDKFDYIYGDIFSFGGISYLKKWERFIDKSQRLLKINGVLDGRAKVIYDSNKAEDHEITAMELEVRLNKKPSTNKILFSIQSKNLDFIYQPPLNEIITPHEGETVTETIHIDRNDFLIAHRPESAVGSYAIFHSKNPLNHAGETVYGTGKVGHIYRPKIFDATGKAVWGNLHIENGLMTVEIPQEFIDTATYPITHAAGSTFGYTTIGATSESEANFIAGSLFTGSGVGTKLTIYSVNSMSASTKSKANVYVNSTLAPLTNGTTVEVSGTSAATWTDYAFTINPSFGGEKYILAGWSQAGDKEMLSMKFDTGLTNQGNRQSITYAASWPNPLVPTLSTNLYSIYATVTGYVGTLNNYQFVRVGDGMSTGEKIR